MKGLEEAIEETLAHPQEVIQSLSDAQARLYYRFYLGTRVGDKPEGDYLEVIFDQKPGYFRETASDQVMEKVDEDGNILGFSGSRSVH